MKPTAFLINTARGGLIAEADLVRALRDGRIAGAGLDVFTDEPPYDHPLTRLENVICTAHTTGIDLQARDDMALLSEPRPLGSGGGALKPRIRTRTPHAGEDLWHSTFAVSFSRRC